MRRFITNVLLLGYGIALTVIFIYMKVMGSYIAIEHNDFIWGLEIVLFVATIGIATWGIIQDAV